MILVCLLRMILTYRRRYRQNSRIADLGIVSTETEVQCIGIEQELTNIKLGDYNILQQAEDFIYLGDTTSDDQSCSRDAERRIGLAG